MTEKALLKAVQIIDTQGSPCQIKQELYACPQEIASPLKFCTSSFGKWDRLVVWTDLALTIFCSSSGCWRFARCRGV